MSQLHPTRGVSLARRSSSVLAVATVALAFAAACNDGDGVRALIGRGGSGGDTLSQAGAGGAALAGAAGSHPVGDAGSNNAGAAGAAGSGGVTGGDAGAGGEVSGDAGAAGEPGQVSNCLAGGASLVVGNYEDAAGAQFLLRSSVKATTFALIPAGPANPAQPPRLFLVNRVCAGAAAVLASDESSSYRVDYIQSGTQLAICFSAPAATLEAALALTPADVAHSAGTGCAGKPFTVYTAEVL